MSKTKKRLMHFAITLVLVALGALGLVKLTASKPQLKKHEAAVSLPAVRAIKIKTGPRQVKILGEGTVRPLQEINLVPQVAGKVVYVSPSLVNGGTFRKGDTMLRIDPVDYNLAVTFAEARVKDAESNLKLAVESAAAAREEWRLLHVGDPGADREPPALVAKEPQLAAARARLAADRAELRKALLGLERTELKSPFDARVSMKKVDIGQYVSPGQVLGAVYSTMAAEVVLPLEDEELFWFHVPGFTPGHVPGSPAVVRARIAGREMTWPGQVVRAEGKLDERTRMINVVVRVEEPYGKKPPLAVGFFVTVEIQGRVLQDAAIIPRSALHQNDVVWVVDKAGRLSLRKVDVARLNSGEIVIRAGLGDGEMVVISRLKAVTEGMNVRVTIESEASGL